MGIGHKPWLERLDLIKTGANCFVFGTCAEGSDKKKNKLHFSRDATGTICYISFHKANNISFSLKLFIVTWIIFAH